ncbi:MAG: flavodoxin, partial [Lachnospiraceae bacterium]|nr:flavodoxin [Lachnospiraceae bacterium]
MKKAVLLIVTITTVISLSACAGRENEELSGVTDSIAGMEPIESLADGMEHSRILIAYFTWAENTYVENPEAVDVDATTSASVLPPGNAAKMAGWIQEEIGGDLFSIVVTEPYSSDYDECLDRAADEKADNARPELLYHVENMEDYDIVFLGFPNWWYTVPMAVHTFLEEYDFSGKTIVPFVTHGTGGLASTIKDITADLPDSVTILEPIGVY